MSPLVLLSQPLTRRWQNSNSQAGGEGIFGVTKEMGQYPRGAQGPGGEVAV